jgi:spore protease
MSTGKITENRFYNKFGVRLDLAMEAHQVVRGEVGREIPGVKQDIENYNHAQVNIVTVVDPIGEEFIGKPIGSYITIETPEIKHNNFEVHNEISQILAKKLESLINIGQDATVLVIGLGNWLATPDALGPQVINKTIVTRHLKDYAPEELAGGLRPVCALTPGVLGITGIETAEIIKGVVDKVKPSLIIAIDALAARNVERIGTTIQLANTGINPGSGIGNKRIGINEESMGVPVIAIGVPTVVHAAVIAKDSIDALLHNLKLVPGLSTQINEDIISTAIDNVLQPFANNLIVTPKEIDSLIESSSKIIASGISQALHPSINSTNINSYIH